MIRLLREQNEKKDREIFELKRMVGGGFNSSSQSRLNSSPSKRPTPVGGKDFIVENKLQVLKKSMAKHNKPSSEMSILPEIRESR